MNDLFQLFYQYSFIFSLWGAILLHLILPIPPHLHPVSLWKKWANILANKVNTSPHYSQATISGSLAWLLMCVPTFILLIILKSLMWRTSTTDFTPLFDLILLLFALGWRQHHQFTKHFIIALYDNERITAQSLLSPIVNRDTDGLSRLELGKTGAETIIMGYGRNVIAVLFWFGCFGGIGALMYRLIVELARTWSPSRNEFYPFGVAAIRILAACDIIPLRIFSLLILIGKKGISLLQATLHQSKVWPLPGPSWLLCATGNKFNLALGGPTIYNEEKVMRPRIGGSTLPLATSLWPLNFLFMTRIGLWLVLESTLLFMMS